MYLFQFLDQIHKLWLIQILLIFETDKNTFLEGGYDVVVIIDYSYHPQN